MYPSPRIKFHSGIVACLLAVAVMHAAGQNAQTVRIKNVLLVHGAWADGSSWSKVIPLLQAKGLHVVAVQTPLTSLADDVATVERAIQLQDGPVLLVGHSYGGAVITQAGNDPKVAGLVYVAAFAPDAGQTVLSIEAPYPVPPLNSELTVDAYGFLLISPTGVAHDFAQDLSRTEKKLLTATQGPTNVACITSPITAAAWHIKPTWFAVASEDRAIPPQLEMAEAAAMGAATITLDSSHVAMLSHPREIAELIVDATRGRR